MNGSIAKDNTIIYNNYTVVGSTLSGNVEIQGSAQPLPVWENFIGTYPDLATPLSGPIIQGITNNPVRIYQSSIEAAVYISGDGIEINQSAFGNTVIPGDTNSTSITGSAKFIRSLNTGTLTLSDTATIEYSYLNNSTFTTASGNAYAYQLQNNDHLTLTSGANISFGWNEGGTWTISAARNNMWCTAFDDPPYASVGCNNTSDLTSILAIVDVLLPPGPTVAIPSIPAPILDPAVTSYPPIPFL